MFNLSFPLFITWSITSNCNLRCKHCFREEYDCEQLDKDTIDKFTNFFIDKKVNRIILTGGEPLKSKNLFYIVEKLRGKIKLGIATNGTLLTKDIITRLIDNGVKDYQISLDGATPKYNDYIRGVGVFDKVVENIKLLNEFNCNITIAMTVNSFNYDDIYNNAISLIKNLNIKRLRIEYYIPVNKKDDLKSVSEQKMMYLINHLKEDTSDIKLQYPTFDKITGCGAGIYNCVLNSDLTISPCDLLTYKYRSKKVDINNFQKCWLEDEAFITWRKKSKCMSCNNKYKCLAMEEIKNG